jgi:hypothetical protein
MTLAQIDVRDESAKIRSAPRPAVSREIVNSEVIESPETISNKLFSRIGVVLFYGVVFGLSGWNLFRLIAAVLK